MGLGEPAREMATGLGTSWWGGGLGGWWAGGWGSWLAMSLGERSVSALAWVHGGVRG